MDLQELLEPLEIEPRSRRGWPYAFLAAAIVLVAGVWWFAWRSDPEAVTATPTTISSATSAAPASERSTVDGTPAPTQAPTTTVADPTPDLTADIPSHTEVAITADDGTALSGLLFEGGDIGLLVIPGFDTGAGGTVTVEDLLPFGAALARSGYTVLMYDHRGHGASAGERNHRSMVDDMAAAYRVLADQQVSQTHVFAFGVAGTGAIVAAAEEVIAPVGIATIFARGQYVGIDAEAAIAETDQRYLFMSVDAGRSTQWAKRIIENAPENAAVLEELPAPPNGSDPLVTFWPNVFERTLAFFEATA